MATLATRLVAVEPLPVPGPEQVTWTVPEAMSLEQLQQLWGVRADRLQALNPQSHGTVTAGEPLVVFRRNQDEPTRSVGHPARGNLRRGIPMPEGDGWRLRRLRRRAFGSRTTVRALTTALSTLHQARPDPLPVAVGELSRRRGGELPPHRSHQSGRDVDVGYVLRVDPPDPDTFTTATEDRLDADGTWVLIRELARTGAVERIFVSGRLLPALAEAAARDPEAGDLAYFFRRHNPDWSQRVLLEHAPGHRNHMHVRFRCDRSVDLCRSLPAK